MRERATEGKIMRPKRNFLFVGTTVVTLGVVAAVIGPTTSNQAAPLPVSAPFASSNGSKPPAGQYSGPLFALSYAYPAVSKTPPMPWRTAIGNGLITTGNAGTYARALKQSIGGDMRILIEVMAIGMPRNAVGIMSRGSAPSANRSTVCMSVHPNWAHNYSRRAD